MSFINCKLNRIFIPALAIYVAGCFYVAFSVFSKSSEWDKAATFFYGFTSPIAIAWLIAGYIQNAKSIQIQAEKDFFITFSDKVENELLGHVISMHRMLCQKTKNDLNFSQAQKENLEEFSRGNKNILVHAVMAYAGGDDGKGYKNNFDHGRSKLYFNISKNQFVIQYRLLLTQIENLSIRATKDMMTKFYTNTEMYKLFQILEKTPDV